MKNRELLLLMMAALLLAGCSSTHIQSTRHPAGASVPPFRSVTVIGMDQRPDVREPFENDVVLYLREHGVEGSASYPRISLAAMKTDKEQVRKELVAAGAQSMLIVQVTQRADFTTGSPPSLGSIDMGAVDEAAYNLYTEPGGEINTGFQIGSRLYRVSDGAVIWSCLLQTVMTENADSLVFMRGIAKTIVERMAKDKVIP